MLFALSLLASAGVARAENYAVLVAGSKTYSNYRHQADICHAYQIVTKNGINPDNIITMAFDDIASSRENPFPGKVFNKPTDEGTPGVDVYAGCNIDYKGDDVTPANFMKVLTGDASAGGKVLKSTSEDKVFINFADHGGVGIIAFPSGGMLHADDLVKTLQTMNEKKMYKELVFYMEACESGSMFENLPTDINVYATTAANAKESSWGTYCPPSDKVDGKSLNTCLGDLYSVNWMEDADQDDQTETLDEQFTKVQNLTAKSHVTKFGTDSMGSEKADGWWGKVKAAATTKKSVAPGDAKTKSSSAVSSRDVEIMTRFSQYLNADPENRFERSRLARKLIAEVQAREKADSVFAEIAKRISGARAGEMLSTSRSPTQWACHKAAVKAIDQHCGGFTDYSLRHMRTIVNICEAGNGKSDALVQAIEQVCL